MGEFIGVRSPLDWMIEVGAKRLPVESLFKREALMFSRIACPQLGQVVSAFGKLSDVAPELSDEICAHVDFLRERGVIFDDVSLAEGEDLSRLMKNVQFQAVSLSEKPIARAVIEEIKNAGLEDVLVKGNDLTVDEMLPHLDSVPFVFGPMFLILQLMTRKISIQLRVLNGIDAYPVFSEIVPGITVQGTKASDVIDVVIKALPIPDDTVPWEQIIEYRSDPESQRKFLALRRWMSKVGTGRVSPIDLELELDDLINQYRGHLKLHRMKIRTSILEAVVAAGANIFSLNWDQAVHNLFSIRQSQLELLQEEMSSPGSEVAYIVGARERFESAHR